MIVDLSNMASIWKASYHGLSNMESLMNQTEGRWKISSPLKDGGKEVLQINNDLGIHMDASEKNGKNMTHDWIVRRKNNSL